MDELAASGWRYRKPESRDTSASGAVAWLARGGWKWVAGGIAILAVLVGLFLLRSQFQRKIDTSAYHWASWLMVVCAVNAIFRLFDRSTSVLFDTSTSDVYKIIWGLVILVLYCLALISSPTLWVAIGIIIVHLVFLININSENTTHTRIAIIDRLIFFAATGVSGYSFFTMRGASLIEVLFWLGASGLAAGGLLLANKD